MLTLLKIRQVKSAIGQPRRIRLTLKGLGLRKIGSHRIIKDTLSLRGMIKKVRHIINVKIFKI